MWVPENAIPKVTNLPSHTIQIGAINEDHHPGEEEGEAEGEPDADEEAFEGGKPVVIGVNPIGALMNMATQAFASVGPDPTSVVSAEVLAGFCQQRSRKCQRATDFL